MHIEIFSMINETKHYLIKMKIRCNNLFLVLEFFYLGALILATMKLRTLRAPHVKSGGDARRPIRRATSTPYQRRAHCSQLVVPKISPKCFLKFFIKQKSI